MSADPIRFGLAHVHEAEHPTGLTIAQLTAPLEELAGL
jgi:hypothetical protein